MQNLLTGIYRSSFAKWSFPRVSEYASLSRFVEPMSTVSNSNIEKAANLLSMRYRETALETVSLLYTMDKYPGEYKVSGESFRKEMLDGSYEYGSNIEIKYAGKYDLRSFSQFPIKGGVFTQSPIEYEKVLYKENVRIGETILDKTLEVPSSIYITVEDVQSGEFYIYGNDKDGNIISERLYAVHPNIAFESTFKYKCVFKVVSDFNATISNYVDCSNNTSIESSVSAPKRIADNNGDFIIPALKVQDTRVSVINTADSMLTEVLFFNTGIPSQKSFLTANMDILSIDDNGWLNSYKPDHGLSSFPVVNGSFNTSDCVFVDSDISEVGEHIVFNLRAYKLSSKYETLQVKISLENNGEVVYLNNLGMFVEDKNTWIKISDINDSLKIKILCENSRPYIFKVVTDGGEELYAGSYQSVAGKNAIIGNVSDMIIFDKEMYVKIGGSWFMYTPSRCIYMDHVEGMTVMDQNYHKVDIK